MTVARLCVLGTILVSAFQCTQAFLGPSTPAPPTRTTLHSSVQATAMPSKRTKRVEELREEILSLVAMPDGDQNVEIQRMARAKRMDFLLPELAKLYIPAQTVQFANLGLQGPWVHHFTSWRGRAPDTEAQTAVTLKEVVQVFSPNLTSGQITSQIHWRAVTVGEPPLDGRFEVTSKYCMSSRGVLEMTLEEQALYPNRAPKDPQGLLKGLQRLCPVDLWDPDATFVETTYLDHELRVVQTHSTRFGTISNFFVRKDSQAAEFIQQFRQDY